MASVDGNEPVAQLVGGGVQGDGDRGVGLGGHAAQRRDEAHGGDAHAPQREIGAQRVRQDLDRLQRRALVVKRLPLTRFWMRREIA